MLPYHTILHHAIPYHAIPYYTLPYYAISNHTLPTQDVILMCFSVTNPESYDNVKKEWMQEVTWKQLWLHIKCIVLTTQVRHYNRTVPVMLVGTQVDLRKVKLFGLEADR